MSSGEKLKIYVGHREPNKREYVKLGLTSSDKASIRELRAILNGTPEEQIDFNRNVNVPMQDLIEIFKNETEDSRWEDGSKN